jgi:RNA polymerase sigma-70 factor (ECF subfamily)
MLNRSHLIQAKDISLHNLSDNMLVKHYAEGDIAAFEQLYLRHKGGVYRYLLRQLHTQALAEDVSQEVWGKVISNAQTYSDNIVDEATKNQTANNSRGSAATQGETSQASLPSFKAWLYTIARNKVIDHARHVKVVQQVIVPAVNSNLSNIDDDLPSEQNQSQGSPEAADEQQSQATAITHCLKQLPRHQLDCFLLKEEAGFTVKMIAEITQANLEASKSRLKAAYKNLRSCLSLKLNLFTQEPKSE